MANVKLHKEQTREEFRSKFVVDSVARITKDLDKYDYKLVIYNYKHDPLAVEKHEQAGFEVVYSTEHVDDDRKFAPGAEKPEELRPKPVLKTTKDGYTQVLMRRLKTAAKAYALKKAKEEDIKRRRSSKSKVTETPGLVKIDDGEIDINKPINDEDSRNE